MLWLLWELLAKCWFLAAHISGGHFKKPLSAEEEQHYLKRCKEGDRQARDILIERNLRLVAHVAKKYAVKGQEDRDDLLSVGTVGLIKAIDSFDPDKSSKLSTYAARCIENEILMLFRSEKKHTGEVSLQDVIGQDKEGNEISLIDILPAAEEDICETVENKTLIKKIKAAVYRVLHGREKEVIILRYGIESGYELPQRTVAARLGISRSYVSRIEKKALSKLKEEMEEK